MPDVAALRRLVDVDVLVTGDPAYDEARRSFNGLIDRRPAAIVRPRTSEAAARAVKWASDSGLPICVRGGGHSVAGHSVADGALMVDLSSMRSVDVEPGRRLAHAQGGCQWLDVDTATQAHGLAVTGGTFVDTGIGGLTLGGGIGYLASSCGLTCDNLEGADLVTAAGDIMHVTEDTDPELLWALRGGGGNFGVVTRFTYRLHPVEMMYGGALYYRREDASQVLRRVRDVIATAPDALMLALFLGRRREFPDPVVELLVAFNGPAEDGVETVRELRALPMLGDHVGPITYGSLQAYNALLPFGIRHYWKGHFVREMSDEVIEATVSAWSMHPEPTGGILIEMLSGVAQREDEGTASFGQRAAAANVSAIAAWREPSQDEIQIAWARAFADALAPHSLTGGGYVNYATPDEPADRVRSAYGPERYDRLVAVKRRLDPTNRFRYNLNVAPDQGGADSGSPAVV
jgi:FAD/FMN-containing dehydrogenase